MFLLKTVSISGIGTFGTMYCNGKPVCKTVEREWLNNEPNVSCIPAGQYRIEWHGSHKYGRRIHLIAPSLGVTVKGSSQRTHCLFHPANLPHELEGCIAPGEFFLRERWGVGSSKNALRNFEDLVIQDGADLIIERSFM